MDAHGKHQASYGCCLPSPSRIHPRSQGLDDTTQALDECEKWVLRPYRYVLKAVSAFLQHQIPPSCHKSFHVAAKL